MRTCLVCLGKGSVPVPDQPNLGQVCPVCCGQKQVADPDHDALVERVAALEWETNRLRERCNDFSARLLSPTK